MWALYEHRVRVPVGCTFSMVSDWPFITFPTKEKETTR